MNMKKSRASILFYACHTIPISSMSHYVSRSLKKQGGVTNMHSVFNGIEMSRGSASTAAFVSLSQHNRRRFVPASSCCSAFSSALHASASGNDVTIASNHDTNQNKELLIQREKTLRENSKLSLAPMMEYTDRHFRHLIRLISDKTLLYTEMVAANAIAHEREDAVSPSGISNPSYLLRFLGQGRNSEGPSVLQLGGSDPDQLYLAAKTVYEFNQFHNQHHDFDGLDYNGTSPSPQQQPIYCDYTALNLNCGCPSSKVAGKGCFGAALMSEPDLVRQLASSMHEGCEGTMPITVKCRIGTDDAYSFTKERYLKQSEEEEYNALKNFVLTVAEGGVVTDFQIHARIAVLGKGYSPADNRKVPPLRYYHVKRLAEEFPELNISLNGGVETLFEVKDQLDDCGALDGVMVGRGLAANPWAFAMADQVLYDDSSALASNRINHRMEVLEAYGRHADYEEALWDPIKIRRFMTKAISPLFAGEPNAKKYRIALDEIASLPKQIMNKQGNSKKDASAVRKAMEGQPPLSELIMEVATSHLSDEVLYRSPRESYEMMLWEKEEMNRKQNVITTVAFIGNGTSLIREWQDSRKKDENSA